MGLSIVNIMAWPKLMIETKKWELLQIYKHECNGLSRPSKIAQNVVVASIHYLLNKLKIGLFESLLEIKSEETCYFLKTFSW